MFQATLLFIRQSLMILTMGISVQDVYRISTFKAEMCSTARHMATQTCTHVTSACLTGQVVQAEELIDHTAETSVPISPQMLRLRGRQVQTKLTEQMKEVKQ